MLALLLAVVIAEPAKGPVEKLKEVVVDAVRDCPKAAPGEIVVCARDTGVSPRYRLPKIEQRYVAAAQASRRDPLTGAGAAGQGSCSAVGASGATGCSLAEANAWGADKKERKAAGDWYPW